MTVRQTVGIVVLCLFAFTAGAFGSRLLENHRDQKITPLTLKLERASNSRGSLGCALMTARKLIAKRPRLVEYPPEIVSESGRRLNREFMLLAGLDPEGTKYTETPSYEEFRVRFAELEKKQFDKTADAWSCYLETLTLIEDMSIAWIQPPTVIEPKPAK